MRQVSAIADRRYIAPAFPRIFHSLERDLPFNLASEKCA